jgi:hypothetical protein
MKKLLILAIILSSCTALEPTTPNLIKLAPVCDLKAAKKLKAGIARCYDELDAIQNAPVLQEKRIISDKSRAFSQIEKDALDTYAGEALDIALHTCVQRVMIRECGDVWEPVPFRNTDKAKFIDCNKLPLLKKRGMSTIGAENACKIYEVRGE